MKYYACAEGEAPHLIAVKGRACVNHAGTYRELQRAGAVGCGTGQEPWGSWGIRTLVLSVPLLPGAALCSPARSFPSAETWPAMLTESRGEGAQPIPAGPGTDAGLEEPFGTIPVVLSVLGLSSASEQSEGQSPSVCPSNKGVTRMVKDTVARDLEFN